MNKHSFIASILCIAYSNSMTAGFLAGTLVKTDSSPIPIEQLTLKMLVTCYDVVSQETKTRTITRILKSKISRYKRITIGATTIDTSFGQLFYLPLSRTWVASQYLKIGDTLLTSSNTYAVIDFIEQINEEADSYEVSVFEYRNLYVSDQEILVHNFPGLVIGAALWYGGGFELTAYSAITACGLMLGGVAALCKGRQSHHQEQTLTSEESTSIQPIIGYQSPYSDKPINLIPTNDTITTNNYPKDCFNRTADFPSSVTTQPESCADEIILLMGKNNNHKKPKQENNRPLPSSGNPNDDDDPRNNNNFYKKNSSNENNTTQHPHGKYGGASYHHQNSHGGTGKGAKSPAPIDGQAALDNSILIKTTSPHRIGISKGEIVFLSQTSEKPELIFHGHVRKWDQLGRQLQISIEEAIQNGEIKGPIPKK